AELLHLPGKPAGVAVGLGAPSLAGELLHLPGEPAGVAGDCGVGGERRVSLPKCFTCRASRQGARRAPSCARRPCCIRRRFPRNTPPATTAADPGRAPGCSGTPARSVPGI